MPRDPKQPRAGVGRAVVLPPGDVGRQERVLKKILGKCPVTHHLEQKLAKPPLVRHKQPLKLAVDILPLTG